MENTYSDVRVSGVKVKGDTLSTTCGQLDKEQFIEGGEGGRRKKSTIVCIPFEIAKTKTNKGTI